MCVEDRPKPVVFVETVSASAAGVNTFQSLVFVCSLLCAQAASPPPPRSTALRVDPPSGSSIQMKVMVKRLAAAATSTRRRRGSCVRSIALALGTYEPDVY